MKIELTVKIDKETVDEIIRTFILESCKATEKRMNAAKKGWDTRRKKRNAKAVADLKARKKAGKK